MHPFGNGSELFDWEIHLGAYLFHGAFRGVKIPAIGRESSHGGGSWRKSAGSDIRPDQRLRSIGQRITPGPHEKADNLLRPDASLRGDK